MLDELNNSVEGVYAGIPGQHRFWYSDTTGVVRIPAYELLSHDTLSFQHISYQPLLISVQSLVSPADTEKVVRLQSDIRELSEVVVTPLDPAALVKEAIRLIPTLHARTLSISVHADVDIFDADDSTSLIYYKGALRLSQPNPKKIPLVNKLAGIEQVAGNARERLYPIRVSDFIHIIPIERLGVIRQYKLYF
jgi:hypothetical protein